MSGKYKNRLSKLIGILVLFMACLYVNADGLQLEDINGDMRALTEFTGKGKWTVINIMSPACQTCKYDMPVLIDLYKKHQNQDISVVGIALDFPSFGYGKVELVKDYIETYKIEFPVLLADQQLASEVGGKHLRAIPTTYIFRPDGKIVARWPGILEQGDVESFISTYQPGEEDWLLVE